MDLSYLSPHSQVIAKQSIAERINFLTTNTNLPVEPIEQVENWLKDEILGRSSGIHKPVKCVLTSNGMGTSKMAERLVNAFPPEEVPGAYIRSHPVVHVVHPADAVIREIGEEVCTQVSAPRSKIGGTSPSSDGWLNLLKQIGTRLMIIDDMHSLMRLSKSKQALILNLIRKATSRDELNIALIGPPQLHGLIRTDDQLYGRTHFVEVLPFTAKDSALETFLGCFERWSPLQRPSDFTSDLAFKKALIRRSGGTVRNIMDIMVRLSAYAIYSGQERITYDVWREYFARGEYE